MICFRDKALMVPFHPVVGVKVIPTVLLAKPTYV
jgi:hypothetical protein